MEMKWMIGIKRYTLVYQNKLDYVTQIHLQAECTLTELLTTVLRTNSQMVAEQVLK